MGKVTPADLAINGGTPLRPAWPARALFGEEEQAAADGVWTRCRETGQAFLYDGPEETAYCAEFCEYMGGGYADAVNSGSTAVYVALKALALEPFSEVVVGAVTDAGGMMPIPLLGLIPMVADVAPGSYNTGPEQIAEVLTPLTSAIVVAHIAGEPAEMAGIMALARERGLPVVEDCAQAHGARLDGEMVGRFGAVAATSTMGGKHHATGGQGGLVYTQSEELYWRVRRASDRGKPHGLPAGSSNVEAALNCNLNELACAVGRVQLQKLPGIVARRREVAGQLREGMSRLRAVRMPECLPGAEPSYWFVRVEVDTEQLTCDKATFCAAVTAEGLALLSSYRGALPHRMEWFRERRVLGRPGWPWTDPLYRGDPAREFPCPNAERVMETQFNLYPHERWGEAEVADALAILEKVESAYRR